MASSAAGDDYLLSRDYVDCTRLNLQHYLWKQMFGYLLHPSIDTSSENLKVADIGTGTGVWLTDLLHHVASTAQLDGFDVDTSQAPPQEWLPANVKIRKWDIFTEVPDELVEQYDVVHVKMWVLVVKGDPTPILRNLRRMLKPGGWLQWGELDTASIRILKTTPSNPDDGLQQLLRLTLAQDSRIAPQWPSQLPGLFSEQGLAQVEAHRIDARPYQEFAMHECNLLIYDMIAQRGASGAEAKEISRLVPEAARESKEGVMFAFSRLTVVGQKPRD
ncbi:hypothetical protein MMC30_009396 [Trapelia coarctata]|nr:hypothetical protein [Trapelia coarctata]